MGNCFSTADEGLPRSKANHATSTTGLGGAGTARSARAVLDKHKALIESSSGKGAAWILLNKLDAEGQSHLFSTWPALGSQDESKLQLIEQLLQLDATYSSGGLLGYLQNAKLLLQESREGKNPFDGFAPSVPHGCNLKYGDKDFMEHEGMGMDEVSKAGFVLVAGGLGERLGYSGIKVALPTCLLTNVCFLEYYIQNIIAMQKDGAQIPLAIMTSGDTHEKTKTLLEENSFFGMAESQITLIKQEKVACLIDNDANLALDPKDRFRVQTKPHGHGDVHALMHSSGLAKKWQAAGTKWVIFFQDTNVLVFKAIPAALGVSKQQDYEVNSLAVPRRAKEAIGAITTLTKDSGEKMTINVEYNQLDPLLRATTYPDGDVNDETGYSPFPGNINQLIFKIDPYVQKLEETKGVIAEFVNPKYKDSTKNEFKSATRLECMMQDYLKCLPSESHSGFTVLDTWVGYSPTKNNPKDALAKYKAGTAPHAATTGENDFYAANTKQLKMVGVTVKGEPTRRTFNGIEVAVGPLVAWSPSFACSLAQLATRFGNGKSSNLPRKADKDICLSSTSTLLIQGSNITIKKLRLDGALVIRAVPGAEVEINGLNVRNKGWELKELSEEDESVSEVLRMRGFDLAKHEQRVLEFDEPGKYVVRK